MPRLLSLVLVASLLGCGPDCDRAAEFGLSTCSAYVKTFEVAVGEAGVLVRTPSGIERLVFSSGHALATWDGRERRPRLFFEYEPEGRNSIYNGIRLEPTPIGEGAEVAVKMQIGLEEFGLVQLQLPGLVRARRGAGVLSLELDSTDQPAKLVVDPSRAPTWVSALVCVTENPSDPRDPLLVCDVRASLVLPSPLRLTGRE